MGALAEALKRKAMQVAAVSSGNGTHRSKKRKSEGDRRTTGNVGGPRIGGGANFRSEPPRRAHEAAALEGDSEDELDVGRADGALDGAAAYSALLGLLHATTTTTRNAAPGGVKAGFSGSAAGKGTRTAAGKGTGEMTGDKAGFPSGTQQQHKKKDRRQQQKATAAASGSHQRKGAALAAVGQALQQGQQQQGQGEQETAAADGDSQQLPVQDFYAEHFDRELTQDESDRLADERHLSTLTRATTSSSSQGGLCSSAWPGAEWLTGGGRREDPPELPPAPASLEAYGVPSRVRQRWAETAAARGTRSSSGGGGDSSGDFVDDRQRCLFALLNRYMDVMLPAKDYPSSPGEPDPLMDAALLHCVSHCAKAADAIKRNNQRIKDAEAAATAAAAAARSGERAGQQQQQSPELVEPPRDQGFCRAKVLVLVPMRNVAARLVRRLCDLAQRETRTDSIQNKRRFEREFGEGGDEDDEDLPEAARRSRARKPAEHKALFAGNCDDHFRLGIKITRGAVKLYSDPHQSDIVVCSPLALATLLEDAAARGGGASTSSGPAADWLSSIEVLLMERADVLLMQNWAHVRTVFAALNKLPTEHQGVDIMRVREAHLSGGAGQFRQVLMTSSFASAELLALFNRCASSHEGKARLRLQHKGVLELVLPRVRQLFEQLTPKSAAADADCRFEHFKRKVWPRIKESGATGQLIFVPSYFDYVRLRSFLDSEDASWDCLTEYTPHDEAARTRAGFARGRPRLLAYTERAHFYHRHALRGVKDILVYQLPHHPHYYTELVNCLLTTASSAPSSARAGEGDAAMDDVSGHGTVTVMFSRYDRQQLERVVGAARAKRMLRTKTASAAADGGGGGGNTFMFC